jgi:hypothetical protein
VAASDPYQNWSGAPKHWIGVPMQRQGSPEPREQLHVVRPERMTTWQCGALRCRQHPAPASPGAGWAVAAVALGVAVGAFVLIGLGSSVADADTSPPAVSTTAPLVR